MGHDWRHAWRHDWSINNGVTAALLLTVSSTFLVGALVLNNSQWHWWLLGSFACCTATFFLGNYVVRAITGQLSVVDANNTEIYRDLFENATDIAFRSDLRGRFIDGNRAVERLLGYTVEEAKGLYLSELLADHRPVTTEVFKRHAKGERNITYQLKARTKSGEAKIFEIASRPMFESGKLVGFHGIARDVSERNRMQDALMHARQAADAANQAKSEFLANMSHEIRTPINGIQGFLSLFAGTRLTEKQKEYLEPVQESVKHLSKIINDILDLAKIESGQYSIAHEVIELRSIMTSAAALLRPSVEEKRLILNVEIAPEVPSLVLSDGTRIGQVVANLLNNAIKFTHIGSITLRVELLKQTAAYSRIRINVRDTGIGIAPRDQETLFEPFQQVDSTPSRRYQGTGLGLTITRNLVHAMGGTIKLVSQLGEFTEVAVELNTGLVKQNDKKPDHGQNEPVDWFDGNGLRVLVVDDNKINRQFLLTSLVQQFEATVSEADTGAKAIAMCEEEVFDIILMDIHMAHMDGIETTQWIRQLSTWWRKIPVVAVSADVIGDGERRFIDAGLDGFLGKPVKPPDINQMFAGFFPSRIRWGESRFVARGSRSAPKNHTAINARGQQSAPVILDRDAGVALASGDETLWFGSLDLVTGQLPGQLEQLSRCIDEKDWKCTRSIAHKIAGSAGYIAAGALAKAALALEKLSCEPPTDAMYTALGHLRMEADVLMRHLNEK